MRIADAVEAFFFFGVGEPLTTSAGAECGELLEGAEERRWESKEGPKGFFNSDLSL
jgi:hypothetical protein